MATPTAPKVFRHDFRHDFGSSDTNVCVGSGFGRVVKVVMMGMAFPSRTLTCRGDATCRCCDDSCCRRGRGALVWPSLLSDAAGAVFRRNTLRRDVQSLGSAAMSMISMCVNGDKGSTEEVIESAHTAPVLSLRETYDTSTPPA